MALQRTLQAIARILVIVHNKDHRFVRSLHTITLPLLECRRMASAFYFFSRRPEE